MMDEGEPANSSHEYCRHDRLRVVVVEVLGEKHVTSFLILLRQASWFFLLLYGLPNGDEHGDGGALASK